jgi:hypothetical protein
VEWRKFRGITLVLLALTTGVPSVGYTQAVAIPELSRWESNMTTYGAKHCKALRNGPVDKTYYDAERVYYQINTYTGDPSWKTCAGNAEKLYRDQYVFRHKGQVPGYWNFTQGLLLDFQRTSDAKSRDAIVLLSKNAAFASDGTPLEWTVSADYSREVAFTIMSYLNAEAVGQPRRDRLAQLVDQALGHLDQWFVSNTASYMRPFMVGLTLQALIQVQETIPDPRIPPAIVTALEGLWSRTWLAGNESFMYTDRQASDGSGGTEPAPDLNLLIAPAYAWMYLQTGETQYRDRGDQIFAGGVKHSWLDGIKQFNQNYMWSFAYVSWRHMGDDAHSP